MCKIYPVSAMSDECVGNPCGSHGTCNDLYKSYNCTCNEGWMGTTCTEGKMLVDTWYKDFD